MHIFLQCGKKEQFYWVLLLLLRFMPLKLNQQFALSRLSCNDCCILSQALPLDQVVDHDGRVVCIPITFRILYRKWQIINVNSKKNGTKIDPCGTPSGRRSGIDVFADMIHVSEQSLAVETSLSLIWSRRSDTFPLWSLYILREVYDV